MLELFGFAWVTITFTACVGAIITRRSVLAWMRARTDRKRLDDTVEIVRRRPLVDLAGHVVLVLMLAVPAAVLAGGGALPGPTGGGVPATVTSATVFTGDNASGTGTIRIRPSDEDSHLILCEASNNASPEICSSIHHVNGSSSTSFLEFITNGYIDSASAYQRNNTSAGQTILYTQAGTANASNVIGQVLYSTNNTISGSLLFGVTAAGTSTYTIGQNGTVTTDIRGPISNAGPATCGGVNAGDVCINEGATTNGRATALLLGTVTNCSDGAGAAACTAAPAGSVVIDDGATTVVVSSTAVTANSQIFPVFDSSLGTKLGVTCNTTAVTPSISARTAATSFTITAADPAGANPACFSYLIVN